MNAVLAQIFIVNAEDIRSFDEGLTELFVKNKTTGELYVEGDTLRYPELAKTLRTIADDPLGIYEFYHGKIAAGLAKDIEEGSEFVK